MLNVFGEVNEDHSVNKDIREELFYSIDFLSFSSLRTDNVSLVSEMKKEMRVKEDAENYSDFKKLARVNQHALQGF